MTTNPAFAYMVRNYAEKIRNESEAEAKARMKRQEQGDARILELMRRVVGDHDGRRF